MSIRRSWAAMASVLAVAASLNAPAHAQAPASADCAQDGTQMRVEALYGDWQARIDGTPGVARVRLDRHPEYAGVRGTLSRTDAGGKPFTAQLAGDIDDDGLLSIDESDDGRRISGVWLGEVVAGSCGKSFKGVWRNAADDTTHPFTLDKTGSNGKP